MPHYSDPKPRLLLLVEDNPANILVAGTLLEDLGYEYEIAFNGAQAVEMFKNGSYALILMDLQMPIMGGLEASKQIRAFEEGQSKSHVPIIAVTANDTLGERRKCVETGMDDFLSKPYFYEELAATIKAHLEESPRNF